MTWLAPPGTQCLKKDVKTAWEIKETRQKYDGEAGNLIHGADSVNTLWHSVLKKEREENYIRNTETWHSKWEVTRKTCITGNVH